MAYNQFASFYDALTSDVAYCARAEYFDRLIRQYQGPPGLLLDLACGTGSLTAEFIRLGYDVIGVDGSAEMLSVAVSKVPGVLFLHQLMQGLDLYGTVDVTVCALDSLNHITDFSLLRRVFRRVALFTAPEGLFLFDVNTVYKQREVLANNTFFYETDECCCVWQNSYDDATHTTSIDLDFFVQEGPVYRRESEQFAERAYLPEELECAARDAGLEVLAVYGDDSVEPPKETTQRLVYVTRKLPPERGGIAENNRPTPIRIRRK